jgi:hypothetical protein
VPLGDGCQPTQQRIYMGFVFATQVPFVRYRLASGLSVNRAIAANLQAITKSETRILKSETNSKK